MDSLLLPEAARVPRGGGGRGEKLSVGTSELASSKGAGLGPAAPMGSVSRRSSVMTVPSLSEGGAHRLDLLIEEQTSAVKNAQEGLQQSLDILRRANSKEEKESARMQVQSLLSRSEELILLLRVIGEIRGELGHIQREVQLARKNHINPRPLYARQQWLEVRLEKLLLAKRRSRPGAGLRMQQSLRPGQIQRGLGLPKKKSIGTLSSFSSPTKSMSMETLSDRDTTFSIRDSVMAPSIAGAPLSTSSEMESEEGTVSAVSEGESEEGAESDESKDGVESEELESGSEDTESGETVGVESETEGVESVAEGVESGTEGVESGTEGVGSGTEEVESEIEGVESGTEGVESGTETEGDMSGDVEGVESKELESGGSERSEKRVDWASVSQSRKTKSQSTEDSDAWHSESEANWTLVEASFRNGRDIAQSQVLSEGLDLPIAASQEGITQSQILGEGLDMSRNEGAATQRRASVTFSEPPLPSKGQKEPLKDILSPFREQDEDGSLAQRDFPAHAPPPSPPPLEDATNEARDLEEEEATCKEYGFETPRRVEVFGSCSWNVLPLAVTTTLVEHDSNSENMSTSFALKSGLDDFCSEAEILRKLIHAAAEATAAAAPLVVTTRRTALSSQGVLRRKSVPSALTSPVMKAQTKRLSSSGTLPQIVAPAPSSSKEVKKSRKVYGTEATYPRTWGTEQRNTKPPDTAPPEVALPPITPSVDLRASLRLRSLIISRRRWQRSRKSARKSARSRTATTEVDVFDREMHKARRLEHLCTQTESSLLAVRLSGIQELGLLPCINTKAEDKLQSALHNDEEAVVRYQALCSLLRLGLLSEGVVKYIEFFLSNGSSKLRADLLRLLCQDSVLKLCTEKLPHQSVSATKSLTATLGNLLAPCDEEGVPLYSAALLSHAHIKKEACLERLKQSLQCSAPVHQSLALKCLLRCWKCSDSDSINSALIQIAELRDWKLRKEAVESLCELGDVLLQADLGAIGRLGFTGRTSRHRSALGQGIVEVLSRRLTNEPILAVRVAIGRLLRSLKADTRVENYFLSDLDSNSEVTRSNAVMALSAFELKSRKTVLHLLECVDLDPSMYIRIQVIRAFGEISYYNQSVVKCLKKQCSNGQEIFVRESNAALQKIYKVL